MDTKQREAAGNPEEELKRLREKTDKDELAELKSRLLGGYRKGEVDQFVSRLKEQLQTVEKTFKGHISELTQEKDDLRAERDALLEKLAAYESERSAQAEAPDEAGEREALEEELLCARRTAGELAADRDSLAERLRALSSLADGDIAQIRSKLDERDAALRQEEARSEALAAELDALRERAGSLTAELDALQGRTGSLTAEKDALQERVGHLAADKEGLQAKVDALAGERQSAEAHAGRLAADLEAALAEARAQEDAAERLRAAIVELEDKLAAEESAAAEYCRKLEDAERKLNRRAEEFQQMKNQLAGTRQENCKLNEQVALLERENEGLASQVETAKQNILRLLADKEAVESINAKMREALNTLIVKADAVIKENGVIASQLDAERDRAQQYETMHDKLTDMLARVRMASQMLDERVLEADKTLSWGSGQIAIARPAASAHRRSTKAELLDFTDGKSTALRDIICELNNIQTNLAQYQQPLSPRDEPDKKPNIRYSVEKLEVDCAADKAEKPKKDGLDDFMLPVNGEYIKGR